MGSKRKCLVVVLLLAVAACDGSPVSPEDIRKALTQQLETPNILFRFTAGDAVDSDWQQAYHDWITSLLGVQLPTKLTYNKYTGRAQLDRVTGLATNGFAEPEVYTVHSIWPRDGHEAAHVYTALVGRPSDFFNEGIAVALNTDPGVTPWNSPWNGMHVHDATRQLIQNGIFRSLGPMLTTDEFRKVSEQTGLAEAGSFLLFLIEQHGIGPMLTFFGMSGRDDSRALIESNVLAVWGIGFAQLEADWLAFLAMR